VRLLRERGDDVIAADRTAGDGILALDVADEGQWQRAAGGFGEMDWLVACAGISDARPIAETSLADFRRVTAVNLDGAFLSIKYASAAMGDRGGSIVVVGSASGAKAVANAAAYCASKAAVRMLVRTSSLELKPRNIRVNCVSPAGVVTPMWRSMPFFQDLVAQQGEEAAWNALGGADPARAALHRMAFPEEIAAAIAFLLSPAAAQITGIDLPVDAGYTA
jgi:NAD(P)-dependent dehydrogenase (short-subunit alcohol dehydrogenase family)